MPQRVQQRRLGFAMGHAFTHADLPHLGKRVLRLGVAGNYGLQIEDIHHAARSTRKLLRMTLGGFLSPRVRATISASDSPSDPI
jgi:hypothetical protein